MEKIDLEKFEEGYSFFVGNAGAFYGEYVNQNVEYVQNIENEIKTMMGHMKKLGTYNTDFKQLKGNFAEFYHAGTFNINAAKNRSFDYAEVLESHGLGSVDIETSFADYSSKYCANGQKSAKDQATIFFEKYMSSKTKDKYDFGEYLKRKGFKELEDVYKNKPLYEGQRRLVPSDQFEAAKEWLERRMLEEKGKRPEQYYRYKDTYDSLCYCIDNGEGIRSNPLTKADAEKYTRMAQNGELTAKDIHVSIEEVVTYREIMREAYQSGKSAATISIVLSIAPEILKTLSHLIDNGYLDLNDVKNVGFAGVKGGVQGFFCGSISAALVLACKSEQFGTTLKKLTPDVIGAVTVLAYNTVVNSFKVAAGKMTREELTNELVQQMFVSYFNLVGGALGQSITQLPVLGFMLGSLIGSAVGAFAYNCCYSATLSFCVESGFTMFGLVDQNYELPDDVLEELGLELFEIEEFQIEEFEIEEFEIEEFEIEEFEVEEFEIRPLRRGVIGINRIGYV